jgi:hypothetical protein
VPDQADTVEDWLRLARRQEAAARALLDKKLTADAWGHAGFGVECTLKAAIIKHQRFNRWPSRSLRADLHTHNLFYLMQEAGIQSADLHNDPIAPKWQTVLLWRRGDAYDPAAMPVKVAQDMLDAAYGSDGVVAWICRRFRLHI